MLRIRLRRVGKKKKPSYRIVVAEAKAPRDGAYVEWIGNYDPMADPPAITLKKDRAIKWLSQGAQPSDAVRRILDRDGILVRTPKFRTHVDDSAAPEAASAPTVTITRVTTPATVAEESEVPEEAVDEDSAEEVIDQEAVEEAVGEETAEEVIGQEAIEKAVGEETAEEIIDQEDPEEAVGEESAEEVVDQETPVDGPADETEDEARSE